MGHKLTLLVASGLVLALAHAPAVQAADLIIWWTKGINPEEDEALESIVDQWEQQTGKDAELSYYAGRDVSSKTIAALEAGSPPDLSFDFAYDLAFTPTWAYEGKLADVSDVIGPLEDKFQPAALDSVRLMNGETGERSYYAVPWTQMTPHVHYWKDLLEEAGFAPEDVPDGWNEFFAFWCDEVQPALREKGHRIYGLGLGTSAAANDPFFNIHIFLNAYGAEILDEDGNLQIDQPEVREKVVAAMEAFVEPSAEGCVPPDGVSWSGADDNLSFINKKNVVAFNPTLSIPTAQLKDNPENYYENMRTRSWPLSPDGEPTPVMVSFKQVLLFEDSPNKENAKDFLKLFLQPENLGPMLEGTLGRFFPTMPELYEDAFYSDPSDPHRYAMYQQLSQADNVPFLQSRNHLYAKVMAEGLWGKAMGRMLLDSWSAEEAVDELAARMKEIFAQS